MKNSALVIAVALALNFSAQAQVKPDSAASKPSLLNQPSRTDQSLIDMSKPVAVRRIGSPETIAREDINALKNGVLLVRLRTSENSTANLKKGATDAQIKALKQKQDTENKLLIKAFTEKYTFSPVYYFYSTHSGKVKAGDFNGVLLGPDLKPVQKANLTGKPYFIAEITDIEQPRMENAKPGEGNISAMWFRALVMRDKNMYQLTAPFPFYIKKVQNIPPHTRTEAEMVKMLNDKLKEFYKENAGK